MIHLVVVIVVVVAVVVSDDDDDDDDAGREVEKSTNDVYRFVEKIFLSSNSVLTNSTR